MNLLFAISSEVNRYQSYLSIDQARTIYPLFLLPLMRGRGHRPFKPEASYQTIHSKAREGGWILIAGLATSCPTPKPATIGSPGV